MVYGEKTVSKKLLKTWHDEFNENRRKSTRRSLQELESPTASSSMINTVDVLSTIRCSFKREDILRGTRRYNVSRKKIC